MAAKAKVCPTLFFTAPTPHAERGTAAYRRITYAMFLAGLCLFGLLIVAGGKLR